MDFRKAKDPEYKAHENILATRHIPERLAWQICLGLLALDLVIGLVVSALTNLAILPVGGVAFLIAVFYTYGPFAFSRFPLGEVLAGLCEGALSFFMAIYVNSFQMAYFAIYFDGWKMTWNWDFSVLLPIVLVAIGCFAQNFNVMFSDNICDLAQDVRNERFTLPFYLTKARALRLFWVPYSVAALSALTAILLGILPIFSLLMALIIPFVWRNTRRFRANPVKSETFTLQVNTLMLFNGALAATLLLGVLFHG